MIEDVLRRNTGTLTLNLDNLNSMPYLDGSSGIDINVQRVPDSGESELPQPGLVSLDSVDVFTSSQ